MSFSLTIDGVTQTLAEWRVNGVQLIRRALEPDVLTFNAPRQSWDEEPLCDYGDSITVLDASGAVWFIGTRQLVPQDASASSQSQSYTFHGPLRWLAENVFQQRWYNATVYTSHIIANGNIGHTVKAVLDYAIANGAQLAYVAADLTVLNATPPASEFTEKVCLDVIVDTLQFAPDIVSWLDYSTSPLPTIRFGRRQTLAAVSLRMADYDGAMPKVAVGRLIPRPDRQVPSVKINWERFDTIDDIQYLVPFTDIYPPGATGREDGALNATVTIQGRTAVNVFGEIECATIEQTSLPWWLLHVPSMASNGMVVTGGPTNVRAYDDEGNETTFYPRELLKKGGSIADWMEYSNGDPVLYKEVTLVATFEVTEFEIVSAGLPIPVPVKKDIREVSVTIMTTDAPDGVSSYSAEESSSSGDPVITGLAEFLYNGLNPLRYDASFTLIESECSGAVDVRNVVNLFGSRAAFQTMNALVNEVALSLDNGVTQISCGPPRVLGLNQLLALLQRFRVRRAYTNPDTQDTGEIGANEGQVNLGKATGGTNSVPGASVPSLTVVKATEPASGGTPATTYKITQNANAREFLIDFGDGKLVTIAASAGDWNTGRELKIKEYAVCEMVNGVATQRKALFLASEPYD